MATVAADELDRYLKMLAPLSAREKIQLISRLSEQVARSIAQPSSPVSSETAGRETPDEETPRKPDTWLALAGQWPDSRSTEEIVDEIRSHRSPPRAPVEL